MRLPVVIFTNAVALVGAAAVLATGAGVAAAGFRGDAIAAPTVSTLTLGSPDTVTAATSDACNSILVTWATVTGADSYRIQVREASGPWSNLITTGNVATHTDTSGHTAISVTYRAFARHAASGWEASAATQSNQIAC